MIFGKFCLDSVGRVQATNATPSGASTVNGAAYMPSEEQAYVCVDAGAVAAADGRIGGFRYTTAGALRVSDVTAGVPASSSINQGLLMTDDGQVCYTDAAGTAVLNGVSVTADGAVSMSIAAFLLEFADLGAGAVDTSETLGGVTPTFTRATAATTVGSTGLIISVATGVARSYYDPTTLEYLGYLAEGARTNLDLRAEEFDDAAWTKVDATPSADALVAPDGATTADLITEGSAGTALVSQSVTATADVNYAATFFVKRGNTDWVRINLSNGANRVSGWFNLATGAAGQTAVAGTGVAVAGRIKAYDDGWYRCEIVGAVMSAATAISHSIASASADGNTTRVANATYNLWGAQFENNVSFASSYIPTTTAAVARNADVLTYPTTGWLNAAIGTFYGLSSSITPIGSQRRVISADDGTNNERIALFRADDDDARFLVVDGNVVQANIDAGAGAFSNGVTGGLIGAYAVNDFAASFIGGTVVTDTSGTLPTVTALGVGCRSDGAESFFGPIRRVAYYAQRLPNAVLQRLTA